MKLKYEKNYTDGSYKAVVLKQEKRLLTIDIEPSLLHGEKYYTASLVINTANGEGYRTFWCEKYFASGYSLKSVKDEIDARFKDILWDYAFDQLTAEDARFLNKEVA
jgi:hypothetical protein